MTDHCLVELELKAKKNNVLSGMQYPLVDGSWSRLGGARIYRFCISPKQER